MNKNKVLDIEKGSEENNANLLLWTRHNSKNQKFKITYVGEECYEIEACCSKKVLNVENSKLEKGANVSQYERKMDNNNQKWIIKQSGDGYYYIISKCNGLYLDVFGAKSENGTNIHVWDFNGGKNQKFMIS